MKNDTVYLNQIKDSIEKIELFSKGYTKEAFMKDAKTQSAIIMQLTLIGEVSKRISNETKAKIDLPWKNIAGFRDKAIHNYFDIDLDIVWSTLGDDIPILKSELEQ